MYDLELLTIVLAFEEWRAWLVGSASPIKVLTDHLNLSYFCTAKVLSYIIAKTRLRRY